MKKAQCLLAAALLIGLAAPTLPAASGDTRAQEAKLPVLLDTIRANRKAMIAASLNLTPDEATRFWPIYDRYQQEVNPIGDRIGALVQEYISNYGTLSNERAAQLMEDYLAAEADRLKVRRSFIAEFLKVVPGRTMARFYQIENKMDAILRYDLASTIPVVDNIGGRAN
jgi:hypothetical protein